MYLKDGLLVLDKPPQMTSYDVIRRVKKLVQPKKVGHTGTLDPLATGLLILCLNRATLLSNYLMAGEKEYLAAMRLGLTTDTQDITGRVIRECPVSALDPAQVDDIFRAHVGAIQQTPPAYSAVKLQGRPVYKMARRGIEVILPARRVNIHELEILEISGPEIKFRVRCGSGTYVRTLASDIGDKLGPGGCLTELRRTETAGFRLDKALILPELEQVVARGELDSVIVAMNQTLPGLPTFDVDSSTAGKILQGRTPDWEKFQHPVRFGDQIKVTCNDQLIAMFEAERGEGDGISFRCLRVIGA
ncbi:MAG: tRNA pseudouridine(55) synthase TruB [Deltaproteobacteria bacterium]|nr:tRNA pseudouridine(55) synthase TruB [Deltaproteobacteria bacterium]